VTCFDPDAPTPSGWWHWAVLDIDAATPYLAQNAGRSDLFLEGACFHARNDSGTWAYYGPYPPAGDGPHRYIFTVYALDVPTLELDGDTSIAAVAFHALSHTLARAELTVTYEIKA
jgi:Raf-like protein